MTSGAIVSLRASGLDAELVNAATTSTTTSTCPAPTSRTRSGGPAKISVKEAGPLVASLLVESEAPACHKLLREVRVVDGLDRVEIIDNVDKLPVRTLEGLHFGFEFNVPRPRCGSTAPGPWSSRRWISFPAPARTGSRSSAGWTSPTRTGCDVGDGRRAARRDGGLTANLPRSQPNPKAYLKTIKHRRRFTPG